MSFQAVQAYVDLFLTIFHPDILSLPNLHGPLRELARRHEDVWGRLERVLHSDLCMLRFFSGQQ